MFPLSNLSEDQAHVTYPWRPRKRLQLLCDSGGWRQVIRQRIHKSRLWAPAARRGWKPAGHLSGLCSEELRQPAVAAQQIRLQEVLWEKGPLSFLNDDFTHKGFYKEGLMCSAHIMQKKSTTDYIYDWKSYQGFIFYVFYMNHLLVLFTSIYISLLYFSFSVKWNNTVWLCTM